MQDCRHSLARSPLGYFQRDSDVIAASCNSKSTLSRADQFAENHENVLYFPAYEMATIYMPLMGKSVFAEGRENFHVNQDTVNFIMGQFFKSYSDSGLTDDMK